MTALAITGAGIVSAIGIGRSAFEVALCSGARPGDRGGRAQTFDQAAHPHARAVEIADFDAGRFLGEKGLRPLDRLTKVLIVATRLALHDAGLKRSGGWAAGAPDRVGIVVSNAYGSLEAITELDRVALLEDPRYINPSRFPLTVSNSAAGYASIWEDLRAVNVSVSDGNVGALDAAFCAQLLLEQERADALVVGGAEAMCEALLVAVDRLGARGAAVGEGAALFVLEKPQAAAARATTILCTVAGYGTSFAPPKGDGALLHPSAEALEAAIRLALADARIDARAIDVVVSGIGGLPAFDEAEGRAIRSTAGADACILAPKRALGETFGAAGALGMATAVAILGARPLADAGDLGDLVLQGMLRTRPRTALVTSLGFYGNAAALVMRGASE